jgi:hypothetical protein
MEIYNCYNPPSSPPPKIAESSFHEAEFLYEIQTAVLGVFLLAIHGHLYNFAFRFLFLQTTVQLLYTVKEKGGKPDRKSYPLLCGLRNPYSNLKFENSQDNAQKLNEIVRS